MSKIRALIVDDETLARQRLRRLLQNEPDIEIAGECSNGHEAVRFTERQPVDLLFLDVQMPEMDGFEVLEALRDSLPAVVFVTAYDRYALRAFDVHAIDYLLKPFDDDRFERALQRARTHLQRSRIESLRDRLINLLQDLNGADAPRALAPAAEPRYLERLSIKSGGRVFFLKADEIDWIQGEGVYVRIHSGKKSHLLRERINTLEANLDPRRFIRIHRSTIVNIERIKELRPYYHGEYIVYLHDGTQLKLSRSHRDKLQAAFGSAA